VWGVPAIPLPMWSWRGTWGAVGASCAVMGRGAAPAVRGPRLARATATAADGSSTGEALSGESSQGSTVFHTDAGAPGAAVCWMRGHVML